MKLEEIKTTAKLAMLDLPEPEKMGEAFTEMLSYFSKMMEVDVKDLEPTTHALVKENRLRSDTIDSSQLECKLIERAPDRKDRFFKIPNVL